MHILERVDKYVEEIRQTPYVYKVQREGIEVFKTYITSSSLNIREEDFHAELLEKLILFWLPRKKKYLGENAVYQILYTLQDIAAYIESREQKAVKRQAPEENTLLKLYGEEYKRIYKAKRLLQQQTGDPVVSLDPFVIDLDRYRQRKQKGMYNERAVTYEQAVFEVQECKEGGQILLTKMGQNKIYKLLLEYPSYQYLRKGDILQAVIKRKLFYIYWELEEIKAYYLPQAIPFFHHL